MKQIHLTCFGRSQFWAYFAAPCFAHLGSNYCARRNLGRPSLKMPQLRMPQTKPVMMLTPELRFLSYSPD